VGSEDPTPTSENGREWSRAAALFFVMLAISAVHPTVLLAVPFLGLVAVFGMNSIRAALFAALAMIVAVGGGGDSPIWFVERAWAVVLAGFFVVATLRWPEQPFSDRALRAVGATLVVAVGGLAWRPEAWGAVDWIVRDRLHTGLSGALEGLRLIQGGEPVASSTTAALRQAVELQADLFPATLALASMAGLGVAWWGYRTTSSQGDAALGRLRDFRFNDHLVWVFLAGLVLTVMRWGDVLARVGENVVTFMGALYALRGAAVLLFLSGGLSMFGWVVLGLGLALVSPLILTGAMIIGLGDTWLNLRVRARGTTP